MAATYVVVQNDGTTSLSLVGDAGANRVDIPATAGSNTVNINMVDLLGDNLLCTTLSAWITAGHVSITRGSTTLTAADLTAYAQGSDMNRSDYDSDDDEIVDAAENINVANPTAVAFAASPYTVLAADTVLLLDTSGGAVEVDLPAVASSSGRVLTIKDEAGSAGTNAITIDPNGTETIDGSATSATITTNFGVMELVCDGTQWLSKASSKALSIWDATNEVSGAQVVRSVANWAGSSTDVDFAASPYTGLATDEVVLCDVTGGAIAITLPPPVALKTIKFIDVTGGAEANNIVISQNAAETIDGAASITIDSNYGVVHLISDGTNWVSQSGVTSLALTQAVANFAGSVTAVDFAASPYTGLATDEVVLCDVTAGAIAITLPPPVARKTIKFVDIVGTAGTNNIVVSQNAAETIDGAASITIDSNYEVLTLISDGTNWFSSEALVRANAVASAANTAANIHIYTRTVGHADLTAVAGNQSFDFAAALPADALILGGHINVTEGFTDGAAGVFTADVGISGGVTDNMLNGADIASIARVSAPVGAGVFPLWGGGVTYAVDVIATVNVDTATAGALTVYIAYINVEDAIV